MIDAALRYSTSHGEQMVPTSVHDGRGQSFSWRDNGFELRHLPTAVTDWSDPAHVAAVYQPEVAAMARAEVGCDAVLF